jgi:hypothetical protein
MSLSPSIEMVCHDSFDLFILLEKVNSAIDVCMPRNEILGS